MATRPSPFPILLLACLAPVSAWAEEPMRFGNPAWFCRNGAFPGGGDYAGERPVFHLGRVLGPKQASFPLQGDDDGSPAGGGCPRADHPPCRLQSKLHGGDSVLVSKTWKGFACVWKHPDRDRPQGEREQVGWLPLHQLAIWEPARNPPLERWLGTWQAWGEPLLLTRGAQPGVIQVEGMAYWPGRHHPNAHSGRLSGAAKPVGPTLVIREDAEPESVRCVASLSLVGDLLVVSDNHRCGGLNVNFDGVYQRQH